VVPSTPVFEMYPLGFVSMVGFLEQHGYHARIVNLAVRMLRNPKFDVGEYLRKLEARVYGFDLHWLAHAGGSLDLAQVVKEHHPDAPVVLGGLSATYFHEEIMAHFPQVDFVLRGDTTEKPLLDLLDALEGGGPQLRPHKPGRPLRGLRLRGETSAPLPGPGKRSPLRELHELPFHGGHHL